MNPLQQCARSSMTIWLLALLLCVSVPGMGIAAEGKIDLNAATPKQLEALPGIGKEIAQRIVTYRKDVGPFKSVSELTKVKGIGKGKLAKVKALVTIGVATHSMTSK